MKNLNQPQLRTIRVYGTLAKLLKRRTFQAVVRSPQEAIRFLSCNFPQLQSYLSTRYFQIRIGDLTITENEISNPIGSEDVIHITPSICGAGGDGVTNIIAGTALIVVSILLPVTAPVLLPLGIGLTLTGVAQLIAPVASDKGDADDPQARNSYIFNGVQNTSREGIPVPCVYGEIVTGSVTLSVSVVEDEQKIEPIFIEGPGDPNPPEDLFIEGGIFGQYPYSYGVEADGTVLPTNPRNSYKFIVTRDTLYPTGILCDTNPPVFTQGGGSTCSARTTYTWMPQPFYGRAIQFDIKQNLESVVYVCSGGSKTITKQAMIMRVYDYSACSSCPIVEGWSVPPYNATWDNPHFIAEGSSNVYYDSQRSFVIISFYLQSFLVNNVPQPIPPSLVVPPLSSLDNCAY